MNSKYGQLAIGILKAVQTSSQNPLEKNLLGALIEVESQPSADFGNESIEVMRTVNAPALAAGKSETQPVAEVQAPVPTPEPAAEAQAVVPEAPKLEEPTQA